MNMMSCEINSFEIGSMVGIVVTIVMSSTVVAGRRFGVFV